MPSVDFGALARGTEGYSGADLQALVYNAHLDAVHETLAEQEQQEQVAKMGKGKEKEKASHESGPSTHSRHQGDARDAPIEYVTFGGPDADGEGGASKQRSREEEAKLQRKV